MRKWAHLVQRRRSSWGKAPPWSSNWRTGRREISGCLACKHNFFLNVHKISSKSNNETSYISWHGTLLSFFIYSFKCCWQQIWDYIQRRKPVRHISWNWRLSDISHYHHLRIKVTGEIGHHRKRKSVSGVWDTSGRLYYVISFFCQSKCYLMYVQYNTR